MIMASSEQLKKIALTLFIDNENNKVHYAEAENDFVDVLLSFLTLPLGTISRLVSKDSLVQPCRFKCISSLRESVENLDPKYFSSDENKGMLLNPINPMEADSRNLVYNFDDAQISNCFCGYLRKPSHFIISADLTVMPDDMNTTLWLLQKLRLASSSERMTVNVTQREVLDLLKFSLWSERPLTDLFLNERLDIQNSQTQPQSTLNISKEKGKEGRKMKLKVMISKSKSKILFAQAEEDFTDQILSFLTIPLAAVESLVRGKSGLGCIGNLCKSLAKFDSTRDFNSNFFDLKNKLLNPLIPPRRIKNQMLPIFKLSNYEPPETRYFGYTVLGTMFMVTDDLSVKPFSSSAALSFLSESRAFYDDLEVRDISVGVNEVLEILKAALLSSSALTTGLRSFLNLLEQKK